MYYKMMGRGNAPQYQIVMWEMLWMKYGGGVCVTYMIFRPVGAGVVCFCAVGDDVLGMRKCITK